MKKIRIIILISTLFFSFDLSKSAQKKVDKTIAALWENSVVIKKPINIIAKEKLTFKVANNDIFKLIKNNKLVGYLYFGVSPSRSDKIDYMVIFKPDLTILTVQILVYREEHGGEVGSKRWLKQFKGKSNGKAMKFGYDIQNISGATISAKSITKGVIQLSKNMVELKNKGII
jgi:Na+-translocating ferredoxin:NAD+ oxidoreductase RnfG subunit